MMMFGLVQTLHAQQEKPLWFIGPYGAIMQSMHSTSFKDLPGFPTCCFSERSGNGIGYDIGVLARIPINSEMSFRIFAGLHTPSAVISSEEKIGNQFIRNPQFPFDTIQRDILVRHSIDAAIMQISARPMISYALPIGGDISAGLGFAFTLRNTFNQKEELISPDNAAFPDGSGTRNESSGTIPNISSINTSFSLAYSHDLPISNTSLLVPYLEYHHPLQSFTDYDWNISRIQLGIALQFGIMPKSKTRILIDTVYQRDTIVKTTPILAEASTVLSERTITYVNGMKSQEIQIDTLKILETYRAIKHKPSTYTGTIEAYGLDNNGAKTSNPVIRVEEWEQLETFPILPYVYFTNGSSDLGGTSQHLLLPSQTALFREDSLQSSTLEIYKDMLNIIGSRAKQSGAKTVITGFTNNLPEDDMLGIPLQRAQNVQSYLTSTWGISPQNISIGSGKLPRTPTNPSLIAGQEENARVELSSADPNLLYPVKKRTLIRTMNPPILAIKPIIQAGKAIRSWNMNISDGDSIVHTISGLGSIPDSIFQWNISPASQMSNTPLNITVDATDTLGIVHNWQSTIQTERITLRKKKELRINDTLIERFALILFDFDKSTLSPANQRIAQEIKQSIKNNSTVTITGYADKIGDSSYNYILSEARCREVAKFLSLSAGTYSIIPLGGKTIPFENETPQGRAYSRTVMIEVKTPIIEGK